MTRRVKGIIGTAGLLLAGAIILSACGASAQQQSFQNDQQTSATALRQLQQAQPTPFFKWSQLRATLISIETAQADTTQTTSFFFNQGVQNPVQTCPSIGFGVAADTQLTNPQQTINGQAVAQSDPTGVYSGPTTGTYVVCVAPDGQPYVDYWEGFVQTVSGAAQWKNDRVVLVGPSTVKIKEQP